MSPETPEWGSSSTTQASFGIGSVFHNIQDEVWILLAQIPPACCSVAIVAHIARPAGHRHHLAEEQEEGGRRLGRVSLLVVDLAMGLSGHVVRRRSGRMRICQSLLLCSSSRCGDGDSTVAAAADFVRGALHTTWYQKTKKRKKEILIVEKK